MRTRTATLAALVASSAVAEVAPAELSTDPAAIRSYCVWPALGGAVGGLAVAWYGFAGIMAASGRSAFELPSTPGTVAAILGLEWVGMVGGATFACALWGNEGRLVPTAASVITGGLLGGVGSGLLAFSLARSARLDAGSDNPMATALLNLGLVTTGAAAGGYAGYRIDRAVRGPPERATAVSLAPLWAPGALGVALIGTW